MLICGEAWALDEFEGVKCGSDIPKALVGKHASNGRVMVTEDRHKDLGLKGLGGSEISDRLFLESWRVCGNEFELLVNTRNGLIRDVLPSPPHSANSPQFIGQCQLNRRDIPEMVVAVLDNSAGYNARNALQAKTLLKAKFAWKIDERQERFAELPAECLSCPLSGIITVDGGQ